MKLKGIHLLKKDIWLDLELRKDIDDYITLLFAYQFKLSNVKYISIHNPSITEWELLLNTLILLKKEKNIQLPIVVLSGAFLEYTVDEDIDISLTSFSCHSDYPHELMVELDSLLVSMSSDSLKKLTFFTGGSLYTLSKIMEKEPNLSAYIQGGYAGSNIISQSNSLTKFDKIEDLPSWNLNLDINSTFSVLNNHIANLNFISKNVCHASVISLEDIKNKDGFITDVLKNYFLTTSYSQTNKEMHDVLAFFSIFEKDMINFEKVDLINVPPVDGGFNKWRSELNSSSNIKITTSFNYKLFKEKFLSLLS